MTVLAKLVAKAEDSQGYINYVFENLEEDVRKETRYIMCTRFPNWDHRTIELEEVGFLNFIEVRAGVTKWFNGKDMIPYNYSLIQFIKFIKKPKDTNNKFIM